MSYQEAVLLFLAIGFGAVFTVVGVLAWVAYRKGRGD